MKYTRIGRTLICLLLVCVLLVNVSPIRAEASSIAVGAILVQAWPVIKAAAVGLGVVGITDWMVDGLVDNLSSEGIVDEDGNMEVYHFGDGLFGLSEIVLNSTRDAAFENGLVYEAEVVYASTHTGVYDNGEYTINAYGKESVVSLVSFVYYPNKTVNGTFYTKVYQLNIYSESSGTIRVQGENNSRNLTKRADNLYYCTITSGSGSSSVMPTILEASGDFQNCYLGMFTDRDSGMAALQTYNPFNAAPEITTDHDIELGHISNNEYISVGYTDWAQAGMYTPDNVLVYPIGSSAVAGSPSQSYSQEDVWAGQIPIIIIDQTGNGGTIEPSEPDTGEGKFYPMDPNYTTLIERLFGGVTEKIDQFTYSIEEIPGLLREFMLDVKTGLERLPGQFKEWFDDIRTKLQQLAAGQITLADLLSGLFQPIRDAVVDALSYLFAPSETFIQSKVEALIAKYSTADTFFNLGNSLGAFFGGLGATPPIIYIDLGAAEGSYFLGGREVFLDLTWYSRYKPTVDAIIGAFIWLWLAWRVFLSIPSIIHGEAGSWGDRKTDIGASNTSGATIVHQRELPSGKK